MLCLTVLFFTITVGIPAPSMAQDGFNRPTVRDSANFPPPGYVIGPNDVLKISFYGRPDLSQEAVVLPNGTISYPLVGTVPVKGLTLEAVAQELEQRFRKYYKDPIISVSLGKFQEYNRAQRTRIPVMGEVKYSGQYNYVEGNRVSHYLAEAGGLTDNAASKCIILRKTEDHYQTLEVDVKAIFEKGNMAEDIVILETDTIYVPKGRGSGYHISGWQDWAVVASLVSSVFTLIYTLTLL